MAIPNSQLDVWANQGAVPTAKKTHESIRNALSEWEWPEDVRFETYLQGSYKNSTNIRGDSDVDLVVQLNSTFLPDLSELSESEKMLYNRSYSDATYHWRDFRRDVIEALIDYYGASTIEEGNKSIKVYGSSNRLSADVVVCLEYRKYIRFYSYNDQEYIEGIVFWTRKEGRKVINFPKLHYSNGTSKNKATEGNYKPTIRIFKNIRTYLADREYLERGIAPSYFIECLLYNVPDELFVENSHQKRILNILVWLVKAFNKGAYKYFVCQNEQILLFGTTPEQWREQYAIEFLKALLELWENWA